MCSLTILLVDNNYNMLHIFRNIITGAETDFPMCRLGKYLGWHNLGGKFWQLSFNNRCQSVFSVFERTQFYVDY